MPKLSKRRYPRFELSSATVSCRFYNFQTWQPKEVCPVLNLSKGGLSFRANAQLKPGRRLHIILTFPGNKSPIELHARVVHSLPRPGMKDSYHIGVVFAPFASGKYCNSPETFLVLDQLERKHAASSLNNQAGSLF